jgi:hypothetical protein
MRLSARCWFGSRQNSGIAQIQFTFLGTSSAVPTLRRNVTSSVLRLDGEVGNKKIFFFFFFFFLLFSGDGF